MDETTTDGWSGDGAGALLRVLDDLEQQASGLHLAEREGEVADVAAVEYAGVELVQRLRASRGAELTVHLRGGWQACGVVRRVGPDWVVLGGPGTSRWLVCTTAATGVLGAADRAAHPHTRSVADTVPMRALLRRAAQDPTGGSCQLHLVDARRLEGRLGRVGHDFVEVRPGREAQLVPLAALAAVRWPS